LNARFTVLVTPHTVARLFASSVVLRDEPSDADSSLHALLGSGFVPHPAVGPGYP